MQTGLHLCKHLLEVRTHSVHLVHKGDSRNAVFVRLTPHRLALRLDTANGTEYRHSAIQDAQTPLHLNRKIDMARSVDNVNAMIDLVALPVADRRRTRDRNAALLLLCHPVHRRRAIMHLAYAVRPPGEVQYPL